MWLYRPVFVIMNLAGYAVVAYSIAEENIASATNDGFLEQLRQMIIDVRVEFDSYWVGSTRFFACFGNSLGSELALAVAKQIPEVAAIVLNTVRGSTSQFLWHAPYAKAYKKLYQEQGYTEAKLYRELKPVEAGELVDKLKRRRLLIYYSLADKTIPPANTKLLLHALDAEQIHYTLYVNKHLGHFLASAKNHLLFGSWLSFLREAEQRIRTNS